MMKKIIILILLISIPIGLKLSECSKKPLLHRVEKDGYSLQPKDSLWEYVKHEVAEGRINPQLNYSKHYEEPILLHIKNATKKDSLAINHLIQELKEIFPLKEVAYFSEYTGENFMTYVKNRGARTDIDKSFNEIMYYTTQLSFDPTTIGSSTGTTTSNFLDLGMEIPKNANFRWNMNYYLTELIFGFNEDISINQRSLYISSNFYSTMLSTHFKQFSPFNLDQRTDYKGHFKFYRLSKPLRMVGGFIKDDEFVLRKVFSNDFEQQFEAYMHKTYPWRYANLFTNKDTALQNANAIVAFMGLLILLLSCSLFWNKKLKLSFLNYFFAVLIYSTSFFSLNSLYGYLVHIEASTNSISGILSSILFTVLLTLVISFLFWQIEKRMFSNKGKFGYQLIAKLGLTFLFLYLPYLILFITADNLNGGEIKRSLNDLQFLFLAVGLTFGRGLLIYLNHFSESLVKQKDVELSRLKELNAQAETKLLQSQINPHFLYNSLNSIASLAPIDAEKTQKMAYSLSDLFKYSINRKGKKMSTIKDEVEMVKSYLDIEKIRFGDRLQFNIDVNDTLLNHEIPLFLIQPLVENAVKHGISRNEGNGQIILKIEIKASKLNISVSDNGPDFPEGLVSGHGLQTVYDLLRLSYGNSASLHWTNTPEKTITITIPKPV